MTDATQPGGDSASADDPWAVPEHRTSLDKGAASGTGRPSVHDQPTVTSMPGAGFAPPAGGTPPGGTAPGGPGPFDAMGSAVPPPPVAPTGPGAPGGYGYPGYPTGGYGWPGMPMQRQNGMGVAAMVLGILACCLFCLYGVVSVVLGILAIVFGIKGRQKAEQGMADNHGQAQAGLTMGIIGLVLGVAVIVLIAIGVTAAINSVPDDWEDEGSYGAHRPVATAPALR
ncbi:DUF4190 domain-containing protein [Streptomyces griseoflavus]|nr:DUF4190 domain-containing protein [Streptomyces griseoflavus]